MLVALLTDIHGNRKALDACLAHARRMGAARFVFLGDYVRYGADPSYVVDTVSGMVEEGAVALLGNHDEAIASPFRDHECARPRGDRLDAGGLDAAQGAFLRTLPLFRQEGERLFVHASAHAPEAWVYVTGRMQAERSMASTDCRVTFCGHVHVPALFHMTPGRPASHHDPVPDVAVPLTPARRWLAVIGAVGQPRDGNPATCYALLGDERSTLTSVRVPYDIDAAAQKIVKTGLPPALAALSRRLRRDASRFVARRAEFALRLPDRAFICRRQVGA
jgi:diadenosine tetraphosphatase ApaH/serine/threonine PP2A family protein phosphatase